MSRSKILKIDKISNDLGSKKQNYSKSNKSNNNSVNKSKSKVSFKQMNMTVGNKNKNI